MEYGPVRRSMPLLTLLCVALLCLTLLASSCTKTVELTPLDDIRTVLGRELIYLGMSGDRHLLADPAAASRTYAIGNADAALFAGLAPFTEVGLAAEPEDGRVFVATVVPAIFRNVPVIAAADDKEAARLYPPALMEHFLFTGYAEFAVEEFSIKSTKVTKVLGSAATIEFVVDVKTISSEFAPVASRWGSPETDGWVRGKRVTLTLYRNGGKYCAWRPQWQNVFTDGTPPVTQTPPDTSYKPIVYESIWEAMYNGKTVEQVVWEDAGHSYITATRLSDNGKHLTMAFQRVDRSAGTRVTLSGEILDAEALLPLGLNSSVLYGQLTMAIPYSEYFSGSIVAIDLATGELEVLLEGHIGVIGAVDSVVYLAQMLAPARAPGGIFALDVTTGGVRRVSNLPGPAFNTGSSDSCFLLRFVTGRLFVMWPDPTAGDVQYALYSIDIETGAVARVPQ